MKKIICIFLLFGSSVFSQSEDFSESDSGIKFRPYIEIQDELAKLAIENPDQSELVGIGSSVRGREITGILIYNTKAETSFKKLLLITGATHGNEYLNIADRLPAAFLDRSNDIIQNYIAQGGAILLVPIANPDGFEARSRYNAHGEDLNRDYPNSKINLGGLKEPETRNLVGFVQNLLSITGAQLKVTVDYHCCDGSLLYPYSYKKERIPQVDLNKHIDIALLMKKYFNYNHGITGEVLGYYPVGTSKDYWYMQNAATSFTFEGKYRTEKNNLDLHIAWWTEIVANLSSAYTAIR